MDRKIGIVTLRELTGILLLVVLLLSGLLVSWYVGRQQEEMAKILSDSSWLALSGQMENARKKADTARMQWQEKWKMLAAVADHGPMGDIDSLFEELSIYGADGDQTEFARACSQLAQKMTSLGDTQRLSWWNVL